MTFPQGVKPLGLAFGPDGNLYVCDNQFADDSWGKSRLLQVAFVDGKPVSMGVVAAGFNHINGVAMKGNNVYVTETVMERAANGVTTGAVFKFALADLQPKKPVAIKPVKSDSHCLLTITTRNPKVPFSANGLTFDGEGNLFICSFGDGVMWRATFDAKGAVASCKPWVDALRTAGMRSLDGAHYDAEDNKIWVADLLGNSVGYIDVVSPKAVVVARSSVPHDAADGNLDTPADVIRRGDKLYVVNFNLGFGDHRETEYQAVSVIKLK
jgi:DNA-binding beta-propeller fold protein YncE